MKLPGLPERESAVDVTFCGVDFDADAAGHGCVLEEGAGVTGGAFRELGEVVGEPFERCFDGGTIARSEAKQSDHEPAW